jgi:hypothetical protein
MNIQRNLITAAVLTTLLGACATQGGGYYGSTPQPQQQPQPEGQQAGMSKTAKGAWIGAAVGVAAGLLSGDDANVHWSVPASVPSRAARSATTRIARSGHCASAWPVPASA